MDRNGRRWTISGIPPQTGRRALVTGANSGIGFHAALPARAQDRTVAQQLWKESERLTGVSFPILSDAGLR
jgi:hypothetical protein